MTVYPMAVPRSFWSKQAFWATIFNDPAAERLLHSRQYVSDVLAEWSATAELRGADVAIDRAIASLVDVGEVQFHDFTIVNGTPHIQLDAELVARQLAGLDGDPDEIEEREATVEARRLMLEAYEATALRALKDVCPSGHDMATNAVITIEKRRGGMTYRRCRTCLRERARAAHHWRRNRQRGVTA